MDACFDCSVTCDNIKAKEMCDNAVNETSYVSFQKMMKEEKRIPNGDDLKKKKTQKHSATLKFIRFLRTVRKNVLYTITRHQDVH